ncbi:DegT/DnrJ/EryC1/StrS family aminotransferase [Pirellulaceae bacterium SH501]
MKVPFLELKSSYGELREEFDAAYHRVMESGWYLLGRELEAFESEYANYCNVNHCVGVANGLDALHLSLRAAGIGIGDEVIVPSHTYIATWLAVTQTGATPVPAEPQIDTMNIDPSVVEGLITERTKAIIPVHLYGQPADMNPLMELAAKHSLLVLEDAAQAQGAKYRGCRVGALGHIAAHSFYPGKNLGAFADAGAVTTNDSQLADKLRVLRNYGSRVKYHNETFGYNSRMDELQAAFLRIKLARLDDWNGRRQAIAKRYLNALEPLEGTVTGFRVPCVPEWSNPVWHLFVVKHPERARLQSALTERGIGTLIHYPIAVHKSMAYTDFASRDLPLALKFSQEVLSLPMGPHLAPDAADFVCESLIDLTKSFHVQV